ncbi:hypothetical protein LTAR_02552 [Leptolinea tardivitalis]|nr:hypothetical protein LTAR_02552 [Leptolinea tardivitalis]
MPSLFSFIDNMLTYYCPNCWKRIPDGQKTCPFCGFVLEEFKLQTYEKKLILALHHPLPERRNIAAQILGNINSTRALEEFEAILKSGETNYFFLKVVLLAIAKIDSPKRIELLKIATTNQNTMIQELATTLIEMVKENRPIPEWDRGTG